MVAIITGRGPRYTQSLHRDRTVAGVPSLLLLFFLWVVVGRETRMSRCSAQRMVLETTSQEQGSELLSSTMIPQSTAAAALTGRENELSLTPDDALCLLMDPGEGHTEPERGPPPAMPRPNPQQVGSCSGCDLRRGRDCSAHVQKGGGGGVGTRAKGGGGGRGVGGGGASETLAGLWG